MKKIRIFIGSSIIDLRDERRELVCFIQGLNNRYVDKGIYIEPFVCEELSGEQRKRGTQSHIDAYIENDADATFFMFFEKAGRYTQGELELARRVFLGSEGERPKVYVFFKTVGEEHSVSGEARAVAEKVSREYLHYYKKFTDPDTVKLELLQFISSVLGEGSAVTVSDGLFSIGDIRLGREEISPDNVYAYQNNLDVQRLRAEIEALKRELVEAIEADDREEKIRINKALEKAEKEYSELMQSILEAVKQLFRELSGTDADPTRVKALEYLEAGDHRAALELITQESIDESIKVYNAEREIAETASNKRANDIIENALVRIRALKLALDDPGRFGKIETAYASVCRPAEAAGRYDVLFDYASFLRYEKSYGKAIKTAERLRWLYGDPDCEAADGDRAALYNLLGILYSVTGRAKEAEELYREALEIRRRLAKEQPGAYEPNLAVTCFNVAILYRKNGRTDEAMKLSREAYALAKKHPQNYYCMQIIAVLEPLLGS